ncbi:MAG: Asp-tRNA(Asn)/Glu-tRNA(Gln) amidotransferase subunit GatC [Fibrobacterota bacterium]
MIEKEVLEKVAALARLDISGEDEQTLRRQFSDILAYVEHLQGVDTDGVEPTAYMEREHDALRDDVVRPSFQPDTALKNAPAPKKGHFAVPKIIG